MQASWGAGQGCLGNGRRAPHGTQYLRQQSCGGDKFVLPCLPRVQRSMHSYTACIKAVHLCTCATAEASTVSASKAVRLTNDTPLFVSQLLVSPEATHNTQQQGRATCEKHWHHRLNCLQEVVWEQTCHLKRTCMHLTGKPRPALHLRPGCAGDHKKYYPQIIMILLDRLQQDHQHKGKPPTYKQWPLVHMKLQLKHSNTAATHLRSKW
jgi:hypothetical protein